MMNIVLNMSNTGSLAKTIVHNGIGEFINSFNVECYTDFQSDLLAAAVNEYDNKYSGNEFHERVYAIKQKKMELHQLVPAYRIIIPPLWFHLSLL